jgi:hypothetical protein
MRHARVRVGFAVLALVGVLGGLGGQLATVTAAPEPQQKVDAPGLLADLRRALAFTAKSAQAVPEEKLAPKTVAAKPFWTELTRAEAAAEAMAKGLKAKDAKAFHGIGKLGELLAGLRTTWRKTGVADKHVKEGVEAASNSLATLRRHYGKEALRRKKGGALSEKEQKTLAGLKAAQAKTAAMWVDLQKKAAAAGHARVAADLGRLVIESADLAKAEATVEGLLEALADMDRIEGEWAAYAYFVPQDLEVVWTETLKATEVVYAAADVAYVEIVDAVVVEDWAYLEVDVEVDADIDYDVTITDEEVEAADDFLDEVDDTTAEEFDAELGEEEADQPDEPEEFDDGDEGDDGDDATDDDEDDSGDDDDGDDDD